jgi:hypothetical protein
MNKMLKGAAGLELGMADAIFDAADFLEQSIGWAAKVLTGEITVERRRSTATRQLGRRDQAARGNRGPQDGRPSPAPYRPSSSCRRPAPAPARRASPRGRGPRRPHDE